MVDQDIFGALKCAVARGQSLQQAMLSLYNAGYNKQDIEEAARALQSEPSSYSFQPQKQQPVTSQNPVQTAQRPLQQSQKSITSQNPTQMQKTANVQKISGYEEKKKSKRSKFFIISLIVILVLLLGLLLVTLLFRDQISEILAGI